ncbi:MAG: alpha-amylase family glycosyl hydrolase [Anaeromyxobacter sp.]
MSRSLPTAARWWQTGVVYQVYPRSFQDSNGDGVGDLPGITARLAYLAWLGVDAVWISPFYRSPMKDFGYDVSDYCDVDPIFGTLADFDRLAAEAHRLGLKVIVDWVPNHSSDQHPWFLDSRGSRRSPRRDWYVWRDGRPGGSPPNNWLSAFGGPAWTFDPASGQWYLHSFLREQPDLNWRNPELRRAMLATLDFWLDRGVDGFRIDVAHAVMKDPALRDNPPVPEGLRTFHKDTGDWGRQLHLHDRGHDDVHGVFRELRRLLDARGGDKVAIGEIHHHDLSAWASYYGAELDELHMPFNFKLLSTPWNAAAVRVVVDALEASLPAGAWPNWVLGNHDEQRIATRVGPEAARAAMVLLLTLRGTPTLYYGDELGMTDVPVPPEEAQDPWGRNVQGLGLGRDPCRTPMAWDPGPLAGFTAPGVKPWLPLHADHATRNVEAQREDPAGMLALTRRLLEARRAHPHSTAAPSCPPRRRRTCWPSIARWRASGCGSW